jgi:Pyruvate/2-oxoacid:ferredoxin oxidoreductase delta subunit
MMRRSDREEIIAIKREAEAAGCVTWMMNDFSGKGNGSCSCCGCCCHALRAVKLFNLPGMISRPHFLPAREASRCALCRKCAAICPMEAWTVVDQALIFHQPRCIGCGLCVTACKLGALKLAPVPYVQPVAERWGSPMLRLMPFYLRNSVKIWVQRLFE